MMNEIVYIYGLICPISKKIRYIGQSINPKERLWNHIWRAKHDCHEKKTHKENWLLFLIENNLEKEIKYVILEKCDKSNCDDRERFWINEYRNKPDHDITNTLSGGSNKPIRGENHHCYGTKKSIEWRKAFSESRMGEKNPNYGNHKPLSDVHKKSISDSLKKSEKFLKSRKSLEYRNKISDIQSVDSDVLLIDSNTNIILHEFKNPLHAAIFLNCTHGNVYNAIKNKRLVGKKLKKLNGIKCFVIMKNEYENFIETNKLKS